MTTSSETSEEVTSATVPTAAKWREEHVRAGPISMASNLCFLVGTNLIIENDKVEFVKGRDTLKRYDVGNLYHATTEH